MTLLACENCGVPILAGRLCGPCFDGTRRPARLVTAADLRVTGEITVAQLMRFRDAASAAGVSIEQVGAAIQKLTASFDWFPNIGPQNFTFRGRRMDQLSADDIRAMMEMLGGRAPAPPAVETPRPTLPRRALDLGDA